MSAPRYKNRAIGSRIVGCITVYFTNFKHFLNTRSLTAERYTVSVINRRATDAFARNYILDCTQRAHNAVN
jgi:hypothetical protein